MAEKFRRKKYFIAKQSQTRFIVRFVLVGLAGSMITLGLFVSLAHRKIDATLYSMRLPHIGTGELLFHEMLTANLVIFLFIVLLFAATSWLLLKRLNGPLRKISQDIKRATAGDLTVKITLRKNDEFQDFAEDLNSMLSILQGQLLLARQQNEELRQLVATFLQTGEENVPLAHAEQEQIQHQIRALQTTLEKFTL